ncbi:MAG TPA: hypothetical protein VGN13_06930 [Solirubrobacteraceae bacterium]|jgi:hypothetical protein
MGKRTARHLATICAMLAGPLLIGCGTSAGGRPFQVRSPPGEPSFVAAPAVVTRTCRNAATPVRFAVLCPARWPSARTPRPPQLRWITLRHGVYLLNAFNGVQELLPHIFHLLIGGQRHTFGAHWRSIDPGLRITTRLIRIPMRGGGTFVQQRPASRIGMSTVHGRPALVLREPPYPQGGLHGGHVIVLFNQAGHGYLASVHGIGMTQSELVAASVALANSMTG